MSDKSGKLALKARRLGLSQHLGKPPGQGVSVPAGFFHSRFAFVRFGRVSLCYRIGDGIMRLNMFSAAGAAIGRHCLKVPCGKAQKSQSRNDGFSPTNRFMRLGQRRKPFTGSNILNLTGAKRSCQPVPGC